MTALDDLHGLYRSRLQALTGFTQTATANLFNRLFNPLDPAATLPTIGTGTGAIVSQAQAGAVVEVVNWLESLLRLQGFDDFGGIAPAVDYVGTTDTAMSLMELTGGATGAYFARIGEGWSAEEAAASTASYMDRIAASEPYRVANNSTLDILRTDDRFTARYIRLTRPDACEFCQLIHDRGYIEANAGFAAHNHCRCTIGPETNPAYSRQARQRARRAESMSDAARQRRARMQAETRERNRRAALARRYAEQRGYP